MKTTRSLGLLVTLAVISVCLFTSCAQVKVTHVDHKDTSDGVHFYEPRPYLVVTKVTGTTEFTNQIIWLPDPSQRYRVEIKPGWGTVKGSVNLQNGWMLESLGAETDSKIPETITAIGGFVTAVAGVRQADGTRASVNLKEGLYLIEIDNEGEVSFRRTGLLRQ